MNENPEGTPNPLEQAPGAVAPTPVAPEPAAAPAEATPTPAATPTTEPVAPATPKKKKTGIIIGAIIGALAIAGGVAAILIIFVFGKSGNPVSDAFVRMLSNEERKVAVAGTFDYNLMGTPFAVSYNAQVDTVAKVGVVTADISGEYSGMSLDVNLEARLTGNDKLYLKVGGISSMFNGMFEQLGVDCETEDCSSYLSLITSSMDESNPIMSAITALMQIDDKWIKIDGIDFNSLPLMLGLNADDILARKNELVESYNKNPFLTSDTKDIKVAKKANDIYRVGIDFDKMAEFINEMVRKSCDPDSECGFKGYTGSEVKTMIGSFGDVYVEVDGNNNFTRIYVDADTEEPADTTTTNPISIIGSQKLDFAISYPASVNVSEPTDYITSDQLMTIFESLGGLMSGYMNGSYNSGSSTIIDYDSLDDLDYDSLDSFEWLWDDEED